MLKLLSKKRVLKFFLSIIILYCLYWVIYKLQPFSWVADYNTRYPKDFSKEKFYSDVKEGMTPKEVLSVIGQPFSDYSEDFKDGCWGYSGGDVGSIKVIPPFAEDIWYRSLRVCFKDGKVAAISDYVFNN